MPRSSTWFFDPVCATQQYLLAVNKLTERVPLPASVCMITYELSVSRNMSSTSVISSGSHSCTTRQTVGWSTTS